MRSRGSVLLVVLVFSAVLVLITHAAFDGALLQWKMVNNFQSKQSLRGSLEGQLIRIEENLSKSTKNIPKEAHLYQFVPDTLHFGEDKGVNFYQVALSSRNIQNSHMSLSASFAVRSVPISSDEPIQVFNPKECKYASVRRYRFYASCNRWVDMALCSKQVLFYDAISGEHLHSISLASSTDGTEFSIPTFVDTKSKGKADTIYIGDNRGNLLKVNVASIQVAKWSLLDLYPLEGKLQQPIVGRSVNSDGVIVYILSTTATNDTLYALHDTHLHSFAPLFSFSSKQITSQLMLRHGYLVFSALEDEHQLRVLDAYSGKTIRRATLRPVLSSVSRAYHPSVQIMNEVPLGKLCQVNIPFRGQGAHCRIDLDSGRLGRWAFSEKH